MAKAAILIAIALSLVVGGSLTAMHVWNARTAPIPPSIDLSRVVIGQTTVDEFDAILGGGTGKSHGCTGSYIAKSIKAPSVWYARDIEVVGCYRGANTGDRGSSRMLHPDGDSVIHMIEINEIPRVDPSSSGLIERIVGRFLEWEHERFSSSQRRLIY